MKKMPTIAGMLFLLAALQSPAADNTCGRRCLIKMMDRYLAALAKHDPSRAPLASNVQFVENTEKTEIGKGLWKTISGPPLPNFQIRVADPVTGQVGFIGVIHVDNKPAIVGARLKLTKGQITEIDHLVVRKPKEQIESNFIHPRAAFAQPLKSSERVSRGQMLEAANAYYDSIVRVDGKVAPFAPGCQRRENGVITANHQNQTHEEAANDDFSVFRKMECGDQISSGVWSSITGIDHRRLLAVDEEMGLIFAFSIFRHDGKSEFMKITGVPGIKERRNQYGAFDTVAAHVFKLKNGRIHEIEAIGYMDKHGIHSGWGGK